MNYIFDFDGTIVDSLEAFITVFNKNIRHVDNPLTKQEIETLRNMTSRQALKHVGIRWWHLPKLILEGIPEFHKLLPSLKPFVNLEEVLRDMQARGDKMFMVTSNTKGSVDTFLNQHKLGQYFTAIDTGASVFNKSRYIRRMIKKYSLKRRETVYVGDETRDIRAGHMARIKVVSVTWGFNTAKILKKRHPNFVVDDPRQLLEVKL